jgi:ketosteroid isomerase-like protein
VSEENVEIVRRSIEAFFEGDWELVTSAYAADVEWVEMPSLGPDASTYIGHEELRKAATSWIEMWSEYDIEVERYARRGDDVVVLAREQGRGGSSGATVARELGEIFTVRRNEVVRVRLYGSWAEALKAAGLSE